MTDKIIIDGVDVSGCVYRDFKNRCCCDSSKPNEGEPRITGNGGCEYNPNCYYKQLTRKTEECERYKNEPTANLISQFEAEKLKVEYLKEEYKILQDNFETSNRDNLELLEDYIQALKDINRFSDELNDRLEGFSYEQALITLIQETIRECEVLNDD